jgi:peptidoglycan/LPS O-acetylase OafA/YrhL
MSPWLALACAAALVVTSYAGVGARVALGACGSYLVLYLAFLPGRLNGFGRRGDFSYGIYLYGFPLQQTATALMGGWMPWWMNAAAGFCLALLAAALSWHLVEKPALSLKDSPSRAARPIEMGKAS